MAATLSFCFCLDSSNQQSLLFKTHLLKSSQTPSFTLTSPKPAHPLPLLHKFNRCNFTPCYSSSSSPSESSHPNDSSPSESSYLNDSSPSETYLSDSSSISPSESSLDDSSSSHSLSESYPNDSSSQSFSQSYLDDPLRLNGFVTTQELHKLQILQKFQYFHEFESGSLCVRVMDAEEMDITVGLLAESFAESMGLPTRYVNILAFLVKQYMIERRALRPNTATLIGYYRDDNGEEKLAGTVEVSFNKKGSNASPPSPTPPRESPYICNMTVKKQLRRRGIGWHLLKACEELISQMHDTSREVYLHCRMIDTAPFSMYTKAGYNVIKTDNFLILLTLQRRKHLMCKTLPVYTNQSESDLLSSEAYTDNEFPSESDIPSSADHEFPSESDILSSADHEFPSESDVPSLADHEFPSESDLQSSEDYAGHEFPSESDVLSSADHEFPSKSDIRSSEDYADHEFPR